MLFVRFIVFSGEIDHFDRDHAVLLQFFESEVDPDFEIDRDTGDNCARSQIYAHAQMIINPLVIGMDFYIQCGLEAIIFEFVNDPDRQGSFLKCLAHDNRAFLAQAQIEHSIHVARHCGNFCA